MKKSVIILFVALAASMVLVSIQPALAKPYEVIAVIKEYGKPVTDIEVHLAQLDTSGNELKSTASVYPNSQGKVVFTIDSTWDLTEWVCLMAGTVTLDYEYLNNKYSARLTCDLGYM